MDAVIPLFVIVYAVWTVYVHFLTAIHASFFNLMRGLPIVVLVAVVLTWMAYKSLRAAEPVTRCPIPVVPVGSIYPALGVLAASIAWTLVLMVSGNYPLFWWTSVILLAGFWYRGLGAPHASFESPPAEKHASLTVGVIAAAAVIFTLAASRPDADDSFYLSIPATLLRWPGKPVLLADTLYRFADLPLQLPVYRLHSYEVLVGVIGRLTGVQPASIMYFFMPAMFAALSVVAWAQLLRILTPIRWRSILGILFICVLSLGESHRSYGNFAFVRMFQGKAILATLMVPAIIYFASAFSRNATLRNWTLLFAAQVAAIGITSSALFVAPLAAGLVLAGAWSPDRASSRRLAIGLLASSYVVAAAAVLAFVTHGGEGFVSAAVMPPILPWLEQTMGIWSTPLLLVCLLAAWSFVEDVALKKLFLASSLLFLLFILNPYTYGFFAHHFIGTSTYWRLFWALPLPLMLAIMLGRLWSSALRLKSKPLAVGFCALMVASTALFEFHAGTLREGNGVTLGPPELKVPVDDYAFAKRLASEIPESGVLLAPESISTWLPTFIRHPELLSVRSIYTIGAFGAVDGSRRLALQRYVAGTSRMPDGPAEMQRAIKDYSLTAVVMTRTNPWSNEISRVFAEQGWQCMPRDNYYLCEGSHATSK